MEDTASRENMPGNFNLLWNQKLRYFVRS